MTPGTFLIAVVLVTLIGFSIGAVVSGKKSLVGAALANLLALFAFLGAWHAWAESRSVPWAMGYGVFGLLCITVAFVQVLRGNKS